MASQLQRSQFIEALVDIASASATGLATVTQMRDDALARITKGKGQVGMVIQGMLNGKQGQLDPAMNAMELFSAASEALRIYNVGQSVTTAADFSFLQR